MYFDILSGPFSQFQPGDETTHAKQARILLCDQLGKIATTICHQSARLRECCSTNVAAPFVDCATDIAIGATYLRLFLYEWINQERMVQFHAIQHQAVLELSAELRYLPQLALGAHGKELFYRHFKLVYYSSEDVLFPKRAICADFKAHAPPDIMLRDAQGPHLNCELLGVLLLEPEHADWLTVATLRSVDPKPLPLNLPERLVLPRAEAETAHVAREERHYLDARTRTYRALPLRPRCASGARPNGGGTTIRAFSFREESYGHRA